MMLLTDMNGRSSDDDAEASSTGPIEGESAGQQKPKKYQPNVTPHTSNGRRRIRKSDFCRIIFFTEFRNEYWDTLIHSDNKRSKHSITHVNLLTLDTASFLRNHSETGIILSNKIKQRNNNCHLCVSSMDVLKETD